MKIAVPRRRDLGFTLIEQLVFIIIIGILAAIAIPVFLNQKEHAKASPTAPVIRQFDAQVCAVNDTQVMTSRWVFNYVGAPNLKRLEFFRFSVNAQGTIVSYTKVPAGVHVKPC